MSNYQTTYERISTREANRLRNAAASAANLQRENTELQRRTAAAENARRQSEQRAEQLSTSLSNMQNTLNTLTANNANLQSNLAHTQNQIAAMHQQHQRTVSDMRQDYSRQLQHQSEENRRVQLELERDVRRSEQQLRADLHSALAHSEEQRRQELTSVTQRLNRRVDAVRREVGNEIQQVQTRMQGLAARLNATAATAAQMQTNARQMRDAAEILINETAAYNATNHHHWRQEGYEALGNLISRTDEMLSHGESGAAVAQNNALQLLQDAQQWALQVHQDELAWQTAHELTEQAILEAEATSDSHRSIPLSDEDGKPFSLDVNYWSNGEYDAICDRISRLRRSVENAECTAEQMEQLRELASQYQHELEEAVNYAMIAYQLSIDRKDVLNNALNFLRGRSLLEARWSASLGNDPRAGYRIFCTNTDGMQIVLTAEPEVRDGGIGNRFSSDIVRDPDGMHNQAMVSQFNHQLISQMASTVGVTFEGNECQRLGNPNTDPSLRDEEAWTSQDCTRTLQQQAQSVLVSTGAPASRNTARPLTM